MFDVLGLWPVADLRLGCCGGRFGVLSCMVQAVFYTAKAEIGVV